MSLVSPFSAAHEADPFGDWPQWRKDMGLGPHRGKDFNELDAGTPIPASGSGVAVGSGWSDALGWWVVIRYNVAGRYVYLGYCHLHEPTHLRYGDWVKRGDTVGLLGDSGSASTGAHLHLTASWQNGDPGWVEVINPMQFFASATAGLEPELIIPGPHITLTVPEGLTEMAEPIYARGHELDVWYALYLNAEQANPTLNGSGAVYSGRRIVTPGERAIVEALGFPHPKQDSIIQIPQKTFDSINKFAYSS